ncbi:protein phosphatase PPM12 [Plasmodium yoelii yoelii]|uniref:Protein phosphatase PPM12 n=3 Tax=Plasmodium yoelii TaxID=5861 RepID=A0AAE9WTZ3_PLAYO|nr:protein phosphatase PPM12 [Plasmodium yoelii yoelii]
MCNSLVCLKKGSKNEGNCVKWDEPGVMEKSFLCDFDKYVKNSCMKIIEDDCETNKKNEYINLNEYCENSFNKLFNIEYVDLPLIFYKTIYANFFSSFNILENKQTEKLIEEYIYMMNIFYKITKKQKYILLHKANSAPNEKKYINGNYKNGDALLYSDHIIAIADGVSSIKNSGINVSNFSNDLLKKCLNLYFYQNIYNGLFEEQNKEIFKKYNMTYNADQILKPIICRSACSSNFFGASTLLFSSLNKDKLHICSIGDCQMLIVRLKKDFINNTIFEKIKIRHTESGHLENSGEYEIGSDKSGENGNRNENENENENRNGNINENENGNGNGNGNENDTTENKLMSNESFEKCEIPAVDENVTPSNNVYEDISQKNNFPIIKQLSQISSKYECENIYTNSLENIKSSLMNIYSNNKKMIENDLFNGVDDKKKFEKKKQNEDIILYIEEEFDECMFQYFDEILSDNNYKIGNLSFTIKDKELDVYSNIRSNTLISQYISTKTESEISYDNDDKTVLDKNTLDDTGYKNLMKFFTLDRTHILNNNQEYEEVDILQYENMMKNQLINKTENNLERNEIENNDNNVFSKDILKKSKNKKNCNFNNYRFRYNKENIYEFDIIYKSKIQQHYFNCPYQITFMPSNIKKGLNINTNNMALKVDLKMNKYSDIIEKCLRYSDYSIVDIKTNDIIISGSDGLFDNLYDDDIIKVLYNNFYIINFNKFIKLKHFINFYEEYKKTINNINKLILNNIKNSSKTNINLSQPIYNSFYKYDEHNCNSKTKFDGKYNSNLSNTQISDDDKHFDIIQCKHTKGDEYYTIDNTFNDKEYENSLKDCINKRESNNTINKNNNMKNIIKYSKDKFTFPSKIKNMFFNKGKNDNIQQTHDSDYKKKMNDNSSTILKNQKTKEINTENYLTSLNKENEENEENDNKQLIEQNTLIDPPNEYVNKNQFDINYDQNSYNINDFIHLNKTNKKKIFIAEKKIPDDACLYDSSDLILFDKKNNIYLNIKKACDEIMELSNILANQQLNNRLLKKRIKIDKEKKKNMNSQKKKKCSEKIISCEQTEKTTKESNESTNIFPNFSEEHMEIFDKINYDDIQSNRSKDKIILTPISEYIYDKYKKYFNMGKPDDTTVIISIIKKNKYI